VCAGSTCALVPDDCALSLWVCTLRLWSVSPSCGCGTLGRYHAAPGARGTSMTRVSSQDRSERPARAPRGAAGLDPLTQQPARGPRRPGRPGSLDAARRRMSKSRRMYYTSILYHLIGHLLFATLDSVGADRVATTSEVSTCAVGSTTHPRTTRPRRPRPRHAHMHHVVYLLCLALALSLARHSCSRRHTRRCPGAVHVLSLSLTRDRPSLAPSLTSRPRSHRRRRRWCRRCRRSRSRLRRSRHRSRRCGDGCPHPWLG